jgi:hypothetical protein
MPLSGISEHGHGNFKPYDSIPTLLQGTVFSKAIATFEKCINPK